MSEHSDEFGRIREALQSADAAIVAALELRARAVRDLVGLRAKDPDGYYALPRDIEVIQQARARAQLFPPESVEPVLREVLSACSRMVAPVAVAYLGPQGGYAHVAARAHFGSAATLRAIENVQDIVDGVVRDRTSFGVLPFETSNDGALTATLHALARSDVRICAEVKLPLRYHLMSKTGHAADVERIYGTPQGISACERYLRMHFGRATILDVAEYDVASQNAKDDAHAAIVGAELLAELYGLKPIQERIEDQADAEVRFVIVGNDLPPRSGVDRTMLAVGLPDLPGALHRALQPFAERDINLTRVESRPAIEAGWRYLFFLELDGHVTDRSVLTAIEELRALSRHVKVLGSYPRPD